MREENAIFLHAEVDENGKFALYDQDYRRVSGTFNVKLNNGEIGEIWRADLSIEMRNEDGFTLLTPATMTLNAAKNTRWRNEAERKKSKE